MWVLDSSDAKIYAYNLVTKVRDTAKDFNRLQAAGNTLSTGLWSNGVTMWAVDDGDDKIYAYDMPNQTILDLQNQINALFSYYEFNTLSGAGNWFPTGIWSDGQIMWVLDQTNRKSMLII